MENDKKKKKKRYYENKGEKGRYVKKVADRRGGNGKREERSMRRGNCKQRKRKERGRTPAGYYKYSPGKMKRRYHPRFPLNVRSLNVHGLGNGA